MVRGKTIVRERITSLASVVAASMMFAHACKPKTENIRKESREVPVVRSKCPKKECAQPGSACGPRFSGTCDSACRCALPPPELHESCPVEILNDFFPLIERQVSLHLADIRLAIGAVNAQGFSLVFDVKVVGSAQQSVTKVRLIGDSCTNCSNGEIPLSLIGLRDNLPANGEKCRGVLKLNIEAE